MLRTAFGGVTGALVVRQLAEPHPSPCSSIPLLTPPLRITLHHPLSGTATYRMICKMPFEFISNTSIDREARQRIRSQAAKGKNVGRRHPNRRKRSELRTRGTTTSRSSARSEVPEAAECLGSINSVERHTGNGLASFTFPVDKNPQSTAVVRKGPTFWIAVIFGAIAAD